MTATPAPADLSATERRAVNRITAATARLRTLEDRRTEITTGRRIDVFLLVDLGWSLQRIADAVGLSKAAVGQITGPRR